MEEYLNELESTYRRIHTVAVVEIDANVEIDLIIASDRRILETYVQRYGGVRPAIRRHRQEWIRNFRDQSERRQREILASLIPELARTSTSRTIPDVTAIERSTQFQPISRDSRSVETTINSQGRTNASTLNSRIAQSSIPNRQGPRGVGVLAESALSIPIGNPSWRIVGGKVKFNFSIDGSFKLEAGERNPALRAAFTGGQLAVDVNAQAIPVVMDSIANQLRELEQPIIQAVGDNILRVAIGEQGSELRQIIDNAVREAFVRIGWNTIGVERGPAAVHVSPRFSLRLSPPSINVYIIKFEVEGANLGTYPGVFRGIRYQLTVIGKLVCEVGIELAGWRDIMTNLRRSVSRLLPRGRMQGQLLRLIRNLRTIFSIADEIKLLFRTSISQIIRGVATASGIAALTVVATTITVAFSSAIVARARESGNRLDQANVFVTAYLGVIWRRVPQTLTRQDHQQIQEIARNAAARDIRALVVNENSREDVIQATDELKQFFISRYGRGRENPEFGDIRDRLREELLLTNRIPNTFYK